MAGRRPRIVIVGAGFGGLHVAKTLRKAPADVIVVDRSNHHLFQPLLYQVATAGLSPADIASPIRSILRGQENAQVLMAEAVGTDLDGKRLLLKDGSIEYDFLVLAPGARDNFFGHEDWRSHARGIKSVEDAVRIRRRILLALEHAETCGDPEEQDEWLTFVIVGAGPTGVELAGAVAELSSRTLKADFDRIAVRKPRIALVEAGPRVLPAFPDALSRYAEGALRELGVEVRTETAVRDVAPWGVRTQHGEIRAHTVIWAAGVKASPVAEWLGMEPAREGRVPVRPDLSVAVRPEVFVIGDAAYVEDARGEMLPGLAPVAMQQGRYVGELLKARLAGRPFDREFRYKDKGAMATIGRSRAVAYFGRLRLTGFPAWLLWSLVHIMFLVGFRNRAIVLFEWAWAYLTYERGARLITPVEDE